MDKVTITISVDTAKWLYEYCKSNVDNDALMQIVKVLGNEQLVSSALKGKMYCLGLMQAIAPVLGL